MWENSDDEVVDDYCEHDLSTISSSTLQVLQFIVLFLLSWQAIFRIPNVAIDLAFKFFNVLLVKLSGYLGSTKLNELVAIFPNTLLKAQKLQSIERDDYQTLIVCPKCCCTYEHEDCLTMKNRCGRITNCTFVPFPKHSQSRMRQACGTPLLKTII